MYSPNHRHSLKGLSRPYSYDTLLTDQRARKNSLTYLAVRDVNFFISYILKNMLFHSGSMVLEHRCNMYLCVCVCSNL